MEKLTELLNEYELKKVENTEGLDVSRVWIMDGTLHYYNNYKDELVFDNIDLLIISARYEFIKWLVDNDKIDRDEINNNHLDIEIFYKQTYGPNYGEGGYGEIDYWYKCIGLYESLLCNLAISKNPISDLISYLK